MNWNFEEAVSYYKKQGAPQDQTVLVNLLKEIQSENGGILPECSLKDVAEAMAINESFIKALVSKIPSFRLENVHTLEICGGANCGKARLLASFAESICKDKGILFKAVPCMRMCGKGPNIRLDGKVYNGVTENLLAKLLKEI